MNRTVTMYKLHSLSIESVKQWTFCRVNSLHLKTMEVMSKLRKQLLRLIFHHSFFRNRSWCSAFALKEEEYKNLQDTTGVWN